MNIRITLILLFTFTLQPKETSTNASDVSSSGTSTVTKDESSASLNTTQGTNNGFTSHSFNERSTVTTSESSVFQAPSKPNSSGCDKNSNSNESEEKTKGKGKMFQDFRMVLIFILGVICATAVFSTVWCFVIICNRCRRTNAKPDKESIVLQAVKSDQSVMHEDQADEQTPLHVESPAEVSGKTSTVNSGTEEERKIIGQDKKEGAVGVNEVDYASINYSLLQKKDDGDLKPQKVESDYAEIQLKKPNEGQEVETLQDGEKQDEEKQDEKVKQDGVDQGLEGEMENQKQLEIDEVQV